MGSGNHCTCCARSQTSGADDLSLTTPLPRHGNLFNHRPMKILFISPRFRGGGAERCARELFEGMRERGHTTEMWTAVPEENVPEGVHYVRTFAERLLYPVNYIDPVADWRHISTRRKLDAIQPGDFDVVHLHNIHGHWISIKALHRLCQRLPVVWTLHDEWAVTGGVPYDLSRTPQSEDQLSTFAERSGPAFPLSTRTSKAVAWNRFLSTWLPQPDVVVTPSIYMANLINESRHFANSDAKLIRNGLRLIDHNARSTSREESRKVWNLRGEGKAILLIAASLDSPYKGVSLALDALNKYAATFQNRCPVSLLVLGRNSDSFLARLDSRIPVTSGYAADDAQLCSAYRAADITLTPSIADNFPYVVLESFACSRPVVAFRIGGLAEMIGNDERGMLVEPFSAESMAMALLDILQDDERREIDAAAASSWVEHLCGFSTYLDQLEKSYSEIVQHHCSHSPLCHSL